MLCLFLLAEMPILMFGNQGFYSTASFGWYNFVEENAGTAFSLYVYFYLIRMAF